MNFKKIIVLLTLILSFYGCEVINEAPDLHDKKFKINLEIIEIIGHQDNSETNRLDIPKKLDDLKVKLRLSIVDYYEKTLKDVKNISLKASKGKVIYQYVDENDGGEIKSLSTIPAKVFEEKAIDGVLEVEVSLKNSYGDIRIIAEEEEGVIGISDKEIFLKNLSIRDVQIPINPLESDAKAANAATPFYYNFIQIDNTGSDNLLILHASGSGMYIIDMDKLSETNNTGACMIRKNGKMVRNPNFIGYDTIYIYSRNAPYADPSTGSEASEINFLKSGHKLDFFAGNLVEFPPSFTNGMTELSFPTWGIKESEFKLSQEILDTRLSEIPVCDLANSEMPTSRGDITNIANLERFESNIVRLKNVKAGNSIDDNADYKRYHQWKLKAIDPKTGSGNMAVASIEVAPGFDEKFLKTGVEFLSVSGILHAVFSDIWVIYPRTKCDIKLKGDSVEIIEWNTYFDKENNEKCPAVCGDNWNDENDCN